MAYATYASRLASCARYRNIGNVLRRSCADHASKDVDHTAAACNAMPDSLPGSRFDGGMVLTEAICGWIESDLSPASIRIAEFLRDMRLTERDAGVGEHFAQSRHGVFERLAYRCVGRCKARAGAVVLDDQRDFDAAELWWIEYEFSLLPVIAHHPRQLLADFIAPAWLSEWGFDTHARRAARHGVQHCAGLYPDGCKVARRLQSMCCGSPVPINHSPLELCCLRRSAAIAASTASLSGEQCA
jgi:hypothetical protein